MWEFLREALAGIRELISAALRDDSPPPPPPTPIDARAIRQSQAANAEAYRASRRASSRPAPKE